MLHSRLLTSKTCSGNGWALQAKCFIGCQLSNANGWNETENIDLKGEKTFYNKLVKDLHQSHWDQSYAAESEGDIWNYIK